VAIASERAGGRLLQDRFEMARVPKRGLRGRDRDLRGIVRVD
jgi:hypothetical protein